MTTENTTTRPSISLCVPRHTTHGTPEAIAEFARAVSHYGFTTAELREFAESPVRHNGHHEFDDQRGRSLAAKRRAFVRAFVGCLELRR